MSLRHLRIVDRRKDCVMALSDVGGVPVALLEPIREVEIEEQGVGLVKRLSIMRIMARRMKATTVLA